MKKLLTGLAFLGALYLSSGEAANAQTAKKTAYDIYKNVVDNYPYTPDVIVNGKGHWQTPDETRERGTGDCEDLNALIDDNLHKEGYKNSRLRWGTVERIVEEESQKKEKKKDTRSRGKKETDEEKPKTYTESHVWVEYDTKSGDTYIIDAALQKFDIKQNLSKQGFKYHIDQSKQPEVDSFTEKYKEIEKDSSAQNNWTTKNGRRYRSNAIK